jgi:CheY-like chemotaxis protein
MAIRRIKAYEDLPIILLSSVDQSLSYSAIRELKIDAHLLKPVRAMQLLDMLVTVIEPAKADIGKPSAAYANPAFPDEAAPEVRSSAGTITIKDGEANFAQDARQGQEQGGAGTLDILVAEDNEVNQMVFTQILTDTGYSFEIAENGRIAVEKWQNLKPRMILMDVSMPEMNGFQATKRIRAMEGEGGLDRIPVIGVTALALKGDRERCFEAGMDDYMSKPVSPHVLEEKIAEWMRDGNSLSRSAG